MRVDLFDFELPEAAIALRPANPKESAKLLVVNAGSLSFGDRTIGDLNHLLQPGDALVLNNTRVIAAKLTGKRLRGDVHPRIHVNLHARDTPDTWRVFARPARKLDVGDVIEFGSEDASNACFAGQLQARVTHKGEGGELSLQFDLSGPILDEAIAAVGELPLPPYIASRRATDAQDAKDYQTSFAEIDGAVAAPTAGLHLTRDLLSSLEARGVQTHIVTLHVGAGTFLPVKVDDIANHVMHAEWGEVTEETARALNDVKHNGGRIVCVGTTSARLIESAADETGIIQPFVGTTDIFISPGYKFKAVDMLLTNFHLPRSTLFMLVSGFCGLDTMQHAYAHAIENEYRFYSYGDACLLTRATS